MVTLFTATRLILTGLTIAAVLYHLSSLWISMFFFSRRAKAQSTEAFQPATILVPVCGADPKAYDNCASLCRQDYPDYQIIFGVRDSRDVSVPTIEKVIADFPERDVVLVIRPELIGENFKVGNLQNMLGAAKYEPLVIVDSDIRVGPDFLRQVVPLLKEESIGMVTCLYRAAEVPNTVSALEAIGITSDFQPSVLVARALEGMRFALGAVMALNRKTLEFIGGFPAIADYLADDYMLGHLIWKAGYEVRLANYVVETQVAHREFLSMMKHQIRLARGIRACRPWSYIGLLVTHGTALATLNVAVSHASGLSLGLLLSVLMLRFIVAWRVGVQQLADGVLRKYLWLLPIRDLLGFVIWSSALFSRRAEWRGQSFRILNGGKMVHDA
jgi:ceramide glucosyltransferase